MRSENQTRWSASKATTGPDAHGPRKQGGGRALVPTGALCLALVGSTVLAVSTSSSPAGHAANTAPSVLSPTNAKVDQAYGRQPMSFTPNRGQAGAGTDFVAKGSGYALSLSAAGAALDLRARSDTGAGTGDPASASSAGQRAASDDGVGSPRKASVTMSFVGASPAASVAAQDPLAGRANYLLGTDPTHWQTNLPTFGRVVYRGTYPGIDTAYHGDQGQVEYDMLLAPGADPSVIRIAISGAEGLRINDAGELVISTPQGEIVQHRPHVFQDAAGAKREIAAAFTLRQPLEVGFDLGSYDRSLPLVIDPSVVYSTFLGGSGNEEGGLSIAADPYGNAYVTGGTAAFMAGPVGSTDFPTTPGAFQPGPGDPDGDAFVSKLTPDGSTLLYSTYLGGSAIDDAAGIAVGLRGNAYVRGVTNSVDFPTTSGAFQPQKNGPSFNVWVAKLSADGSALDYSTYLGGLGFNSGAGIAIDRRGSAYVSGVTGAPDYPTTPGAFQRTFHGQRTFSSPFCLFGPPTGMPCDFDAFVTKLTPDGSALAYSTLLGGSAPLDASFAVAVDVQDQAYATGVTLSPDFPTTARAFDRTHNGTADAFVTKLNPKGTALVYSSFLGGSGPDGALGIAVDQSQGAYVTGGTGSPDFPTTPNSVKRTLEGERDAYLTKFSADGSHLAYSTLLGGAAFDSGSAVAVDRKFNAYVTGATNSGDFPVTGGAYQSRLGDPSPADPDLRDGFVTKVVRSGSALAYSSYLGGSGYDAGAGIAVDPRQNAYVTGVTSSANFPATPDALQPSLKGAANSFVTKLYLLR